MRLPILLLAIVFYSSDGAPVPATAQAKPVDFAQVEQELARAWVHSDRPTIDRIIASDWTTITITGRVLTRAEVMADSGRVHPGHRSRGGWFPSLQSTVMKR
jgi:hypothetical protein